MYLLIKIALNFVVHLYLFDKIARKKFLAIIIPFIKLGLSNLRPAGHLWPAKCISY